jgi:hypothetical protein
MRCIARSLAALAGILCLACAPGEARDDRASRAAVAATARAAGVVDSALPPDEALRRFRAALPEVTRLSGGAPSRDALVGDFVVAVARRDTAAVRRMLVSRAEFAWLIYPTSVYSRPPRRQPPDIAWLLLIQNSQKGIARAFDRYGGDSLSLRGYACGAPARREGGNAYRDDCVLRLRAGADTMSARLFGSIVERGGAFKFYTYQNDL